jgi:thiol-disulfide isomerase/thioredoxin
MNRTILTLATVALSSIASAQRADSRVPVELRLDAPDPKTAAAAVARVKTYYFSQDFEGGAAEATKLLKRFPKSDELRAWQVINMTRTIGSENEAKAIADSSALWTGSPYRDLAYSFAWYYQRGGEPKSLDAAKKFRAAPGMRWNKDAIWVNVHLLNGASKYDEAVALADSSLARGAPVGDVLVVKANAMASKANRDADAALRQKASETFAEARRVERNNVNAHFLPASNLASGPTDTVAFALLERAAALSPALSVHRRYQDAIRNRRDLSAAIKDSLVTDDLDGLVALRPNSSSVIRFAHDAFATMKRWDRQAELLARMKTEFAGTSDYTWVQYGLLRLITDSIFYKTSTDTAASRRSWESQVNAMAARPDLRIPGIYGTLLLYQWGYMIERDSALPVDSIVRFGKTLAQYNTANPHMTHFALPMLVAERKGDFRWAEQMIVTGDSMRLASAERFKDNTVRSEGVGAYADQLDYIRSQKNLGLAWVYMHEGRYDDAEKELNKALDLQRKDPRTFFEFGKLAEMRGKPLDAQAHYARGFPLEQSFTGFRNRDALKRIYSANNGNLNGFDAFVDKLKEEDRVRRKTQIAAERIAQPEVLPAFSLERYNANREHMSDATLKGKVAVINFWGVWCGPCVKEIPDIQKVHDAVKGDTNVVFLTVDYNDTPEKLAEFMVKKQLSFPVLFDANRFAQEKAKIGAYPTTLFIDRDGRVVFRKVGASDWVEEEFLWRIEMLKAGKQQ